MTRNTCLGGALLLALGGLLVAAAIADAQSATQSAKKKAAPRAKPVATEPDPRSSRKRSNS
jgi:hypothetical protein